MTGHKSDYKIALYLGNTPHQLCEADIRAIGIYVLSKERYLLNTRVHELSTFAEHVRAVTATLAPSHVGDDAVGAEVVAAVHNRNPRSVPLPSDGGNALGNISRVSPYNEAALPVLEPSSYQLGNTVEHIGLKGEGDEMEILLQLLYSVRLRRHTAHHANYQVGLILLQRLEATEHRKRLHLRVLANGAGIYDDYIGKLGSVAGLIAHSGKQTEYALAVSLVLLTAEGYYVGTSHGSAEHCPHGRDMLCHGGIVNTENQSLSPFRVFSCFRLFYRQECGGPTLQIRIYRRARWAMQNRRSRQR